MKLHKNKITLESKRMPRGTKPNQIRNKKNYKWEIVFVTKQGKLIHEKFKSINDVKEHPELSWLTSGKLHYYSTLRPTLDKKRKVGTLEIKHIHEPIPKVESMDILGDEKN